MSFRRSFGSQYQILGTLMRRGSRAEGHKLHRIGLDSGVEEEVFVWFTVELGAQ